MASHHDANAPHVVIIGAGFGGLSATGGLNKVPVRVTVIDKNLYSTFQPLLYQVATGGLNPGDIAYPVGGFTTRRGAEYVRGELARVDPQARIVHLEDGRQVRYDYLIIATGVTSAYFGVEGAAENTYGLYTRADAISLRDHIMSGFEAMSFSPHDFAITVVGGGATGVELAGTLAELRGEMLARTFPDVAKERVHVRLVEMAPSLLMPFDGQLRDYTRRQLEARGVDLRLGTKIHAVRPDGVELEGGQFLPSDLTVWAAGVAARPAVSQWGLPQGKAGRILVEPDLRVKGQDRIFAIGDISLCEDKPAPQLAQPALQEGRHVAGQVRRMLAGAPTVPFRYQDKGMMATIGRQSAVVQLANGTRMTGTPAWVTWLGLHMFYLIGGRNRISTMINLSWRYLAWGHGGGVIVGDSPVAAALEKLAAGAGQGGIAGQGGGARGDGARRSGRGNGSQGSGSSRRREPASSGSRGGRGRQG